jgi:hypothetical protein
VPEFVHDVVGLGLRPVEPLDDHRPVVTADGGEPVDVLRAVSRVDHRDGVPVPCPVVVHVVAHHPVALREADTGLARDGVVDDDVECDARRPVGVLHRGVGECGHQPIDRFLRGLLADHVVEFDEDVEPRRVRRAHRRVGADLHAVVEAVPVGVDAIRVGVVVRTLRAVGDPVAV